MRVAVEAWGRLRWPGARVVHELEVGGCRIDVAFVQRDHLAGVEIKSGRDTLKRLARQLRSFQGALPEVWLAIAPRWAGETGALGHRLGRIIVADGVVDEIVRRGPNFAGPAPARVDLLCTNRMLHLLLKPELLRIGRRHGLAIKSRHTVMDLYALLARGLTGDQLVAEACRELRARRRGWQGDAPMLEESP